MLGGFSSGLKLTDLNDFITPSQECIKPVQIPNKNKTKDKGLIEIEGSSLQPEETYEKAKITLNDCLACSGCITSAEVVLVNQQSLEQFSKVLNENSHLSDEDKSVIVLSVSTQSVLSIAARYNLTPQEGLEKIVGYFKSVGVDYVFDVNFARCFSLIEAQKEFAKRYRNSENDSSLVFPLLASSCPGWVCYAEKTHGSFILPYISKTRSPQQVMGSILKDYWSKKLLLKPNKLYHATLMPCFDKKLEASREEFYNSDFDTNEVDCVITSVEVEQLFEKDGIDVNTIPCMPLDTEFSMCQTLLSHDGSGSGGFAHHVFIYAAKHLFDIEEIDLNWKTLRNNDMLELTLEVNGEKVLRFAIANGFRNIQNLVQKIKRNKCPYHYVEIMACPSGCLNGGAQIRPNDGRTSKELVQYLESIYKQLPKITSQNEQRINELYSEWLENDDNDIQQKLYTTYKEITQNVNPLGIKW
ncbi:Cytosolic Fe-S cluster assembly factor NARFL [Armadillidium nasatum]|uniref:Cytosolic Fe-S cluster assembly factor NARFL n=1 Tax=Armadillidium nasatum TaxID=96803 RepID=A0A5N5SW42_9CRUS|nr:Cytosolic Fe-S cluster assembly factor NARFL [Armadillidium nasatum]